MKTARVLLGLGFLVLMAGLAYVGQRGEPAGARMAVAAQKLIASLTAEQKKAAGATKGDHET